LQTGGSVLIHCRGGLGRTGTIAARLLVELGWQPRAAIEAVRGARPGAIETPQQERHVLSAVPPPFHEPFVDRLLGCLLGGAVGDAFGYTVEFMTLDAIRRRFGRAGLRRPELAGGRLVVSDDTQMTLFTLEGMLRALRPDGSCESGRLLEQVRLAYLDWLDTQSGKAPAGKLHGRLGRSAAMRVPRAPGNTCLSALRAGGHGTIEQPINDSKGCGAVMRVAPLAFLPMGFDELFDLAGRAGALTHGHVDGWSSGGVLANMIQELLEGCSLPVASKRVIRDRNLMAYTYGAHGNTALYWKAWELAREQRLTPEAAIQALGQGWTGDEALAIGLYAALAGRNFLDVAQRAANHDGDSDSTASIAGQLYGAWKGVLAVPHHLIRRLDVLGEIMLLARQAASLPTKAAETYRSAAKLLQREEFAGAVKVLEMVHHLHRHGFQRLRIEPALDAASGAWQVGLRPQGSTPGPPRRRRRTGRDASGRRRRHQLRLAGGGRPERQRSCRPLPASGGRSVRGEQRARLGLCRLVH
jgi:ADP-ribosyl-[dinitrogen reductase] hydrolase